MFAGGIADKLGNRYEAKWLVRQLLDVIGGKAQAIRYEGINPDYRGFEFSVRRTGSLEWHQTKINSPHGNWTIGALKREGVLSAFKNRLAADKSNLCVFVSQDPAKDIRSLVEKATIASSTKEYREALGGGDTEKFEDILRIWNVDAECAFGWLRRCEFRLESQLSIESALSTFFDFFFLYSADSFEVLREFMEVRINQEITTESVRADIRTEGKLILKDWSIDPTLNERLTNETNVYLGTYIPFGVAGQAISRAETQKLFELVSDPTGPAVVLLTGVAGSGKSGVLRGLIEELRRRHINHLALRIDQHLDCTSPRTLGKAITGREESPVSTLKGITPDKLSILIVDQVDAVSEVSGRNGAVKQAVLRLVDDIRNFGSVRLIISCRTFDLESDQRLKALKDSHSVAHVEVPLLAWKESVEPLLVAKSIKTNMLTEKQRQLLCLPLNLAIFLEIYDGSQPIFTSRNDLFSHLLEKKGRSIRTDRQITWDVLAPLSQLAEWMSNHQRLDAPEALISNFGSALDLLSSEGLLIRSRTRVNFFHESFFDYVYAKSFAAREQTLVSLLRSSEQHLFRRTQVRQILETLRQSEVIRYLGELRVLLGSLEVRYHIKVAVAQWLGSISDPKSEEKEIILVLDNGAQKIPPLVRYALFGSPGWFDLLLREDWILANLVGQNTERKEAILWWLSQVAGQRPNEVAILLNRWWGEAEDRGKRLLEWFGMVRRDKADGALVTLCCRLIRSSPPEVFKGGPLGQSGLLFHTWAGQESGGANQILEAYFDAWFSVHKGQHPFESDEYHSLNTHALQELAKKSPGEFVDGSLSAFTRSIDLILEKEARGERDYSFEHRSYSGHHFRADAFLHMFRGALGNIAKVDPVCAVSVLEKLDPRKHEVFTHVWLETINANAGALHYLLPRVLDSPFLFYAGWDGVAWKSFADAAKKSIPHLRPQAVAAIEERILSHFPEIERAAKLAHKITEEGEQRPWWNRQSIVHILNHSGHDQWCVLEVIGPSLLSAFGQQRLAQLQRKFGNQKPPEPHHNEAHFVGSPIKRDSAARMTDRQWLSAIERYNSDEDRRRGRTFTDGGAAQLATELQHLVKQQPARFGRLLEQIHDDANPTYVSHILWGLAEAEGCEDDVLSHAIINAHGRPGRRYGSEIARLFESKPLIAADPALLDVLLWYVEWGEANESDAIEVTQAEREIVTIDDLVEDANRIHVRGINGARGWAAEALGAVLWSVPEAVAKAWLVLERRVAEESLVSIRCCLMRPIVPLYNSDRERCASLMEALSNSPGGRTTKRAPSLFERVWLLCAFPAEHLPAVIKQIALSSAGLIEKCVRQHGEKFGECVDTKWQLPLLTHNGVYLFPFLLEGVPGISRRLIYRLVVRGDERARMVGAWHVLRRRFQDGRYAALADAFRRGGVVYRRLDAGLAAHAIGQDEYRFQAEAILERSFDDDDQKVRHQAVDVFRNIVPNEFLRYSGLATTYLSSRAFGDDSFAFFHALDEAECKVDDFVIAATEKLMADIVANGNVAGRRSMDLHQLQDIMNREYGASESDPDLRRRLLDLIDKMLSLELYSVDAIVKAHER